MVTSLLLIFKFGYDIARRLIHDAYFRSLGSALLTILLVGTLFFWLAEGQTFLHALAYSAATMAMNSPYGIGWGPQTTGGILFNIMKDIHGQFGDGGEKFGKVFVHVTREAIRHGSDQVGIFPGQLREAETLIIEGVDEFTHVLQSFAQDP